MGRGSEVDERDAPGYSIEEIAQLPVIIGSNEAARLLRLHPRSVVRYAQLDELPSIKIGKRYRFVRDTLLEIAGLSYEQVLEQTAQLERKRAQIESEAAEQRQAEIEASEELKNLLKCVADRLV